MGIAVEPIRATLHAHGQGHLLTFFDELPALKQQSLLDQIEGIDFGAIDRLIEEYVRQRLHVALPENLRPATYYPRDASDATKPYDAARYRKIGEDLIRAGKVSAFTVAGGQGTRLGWDGPKGTFPATVVTGKPLFRVFAEQILATQRKYGIGSSAIGASNSAAAGGIPWYIMTSPLNDADTRAFFADNSYFGLNRRDVFMFPQGMLPSIDAQTGRLLLSEKHEVAMNPDGHGGSIKALTASGAIEDMIARSIEHISYFQVDNPLVRCIDPLFIGLHASAPDSSAEFSSKMVAKASAEEKVGVFCTGGPGEGKTMVIEYSDLPTELAQQTDEHGRLRYNAGSIAVHMISVRFVQRLTADAHRFGLPFHRADKKVPYIDSKSGERIEPSKPNAVKLEAFVFDAAPLAEQSIVLETSRVEEFAPIKNAEGADSTVTSHQIQSDRHGQWLAACGVGIPQRNGHVDARIEISPLTALESGDLMRGELPPTIEVGQEVVL